MIEQLGLEPHDPVETLKDTVDSLMMWGLIEPRKGEDNYNWCVRIYLSPRRLFGPCGLVSAMAAVHREGNRIKGLTGNVTWTANLTSPAALEKEQSKL